MKPAPFHAAALQAYLDGRHAAVVAIEEVRELGSDTSGPDALKRFGYGRPLLVTYTVGQRRHREVFHLSLIHI